MTRFFMSPVKNNETKTIATKLKRIATQMDFHPSIIFMQQRESLNALVKNIKDGDTIELHGEGVPWIVGSLRTDQYDYSPFSLAQFFSDLFPNKEINITIELRCCNSATIAEGPRGPICFAEEFSLALSKADLPHISVIGYKGYVQSENYFKQSLVADFEKVRAKLGHCPLIQGQVTYHHGEIVTPAKKTLVTDYTYDEVSIEEDSLLQQYFNQKKNWEEQLHLKELVNKLQSLTLTIDNEDNTNKETTEDDVSEARQTPLILNNHFLTTSLLELKDKSQTSQTNRMSIF